jgi:hypothetical protein
MQAMKAINGMISLSETSEGLQVTQGARSYVARNWVFSDRLFRLMSVAFECGLTCLIRNGHPQPGKPDEGVEYVGFSRTQDAKWVFVVDQFSCRDRKRRNVIEQITVQKRFASALERGKIPFTLERSGGKNLFVDYQYAEAAIRACFAAEPA